MSNQSNKVHGMKSNVNSIKSKILNSDDISDTDKEFCISEDKCWIDNLEMKSLSKQRDYLAKFKQISEYHDFNISQIKDNPEHVERIIRAIQRSEYAVRTDEYSPETKKLFKQTLKRVIEYSSKFDEDYEHPEQAKQDLLPYDFTVYIKESEKSRTNPDDLPTPSTVKKICQSIEAIKKPDTAARDVALVLFLWDSGCRIGEALSTDMDHVEINSDRVEITVQGNKSSDNRKNTVKIATPALKHYIENVHPEPKNNSKPLFVDLTHHKRLSSKTSTKTVSRALEHSSLDKDWSHQKNHIFRKGRITYLKKAEKMKETNIDIRVGHVQGSNTTRTYTRISDEEADASYLESYGLEDSTSEVEDDLEPLECLDCGEVNSGHRDSCRSCGDILDTTAYPVDVNDEEKNFKNKVKKMSEELEELKEEAKE